MRSWYAGWTLVGCRRLVDTSRTYGPRSLVNALREPHRIAPRLTPDLLAEVWDAQGFDHDRSEDLEECVVRQFALIVHGDRDGPRTALTKAVVKEEEERLLDVREAAADLANRPVHATRPTRDAQEGPVTQDDIDAPLGDVISAATRWVGLIDRTELAPDPVRIGARPMRRALELFDWREYVHAVSEDELRRDGNPPLSQLEDRV